MTTNNSKENNKLNESDNLLSYLFCDQVKQFKMSYIDFMAFSDDDDIKEFDKICDKMRDIADDMYKDNDTDLEDFGDLIQMMNTITYEIIKNKKYLIINSNIFW